MWWGGYMFKIKNKKPKDRKEENFFANLFKIFLGGYDLNPKQQALKITCIYFFIGSLWILLSDKMVDLIIKDRSMILVLSIVKGWFYVSITSALIFILVYTAMKKVTDIKDNVKKMNDELEKKVVQRTSQLENMNAELEEANALLEEKIFERHHNMKKIKELNDELENRVAERTIQLQDLNQKLEEEIHENKRISSELNKEKIFTEAIFNSVPGMIYLYNDQNKLVRWNKKHNLVTGYSSKELATMSLLDWYKGDEKSQEAVLKAIGMTIKNGFGEVEAELQRKDGSKIPMYFAASRVTIEGKLYFAGIGIDITELKRVNERLQKYQVLAERSNDAMLFIDKEGNILEVNDAAVRTYGYTKKEFLSMTLFQLRHINKTPDIIEQMEVADNRGIIFETVHYKKNGEGFPVEVSSQGTYFGNKRVLLSIVRDISQRKKLEEGILYLSYHDQLTGLYNRRYYEEALKRVDIEKNLPITLVMGDINGLKLINDAFGHLAGDKLIMEIANILKVECRTEDILARIGGDEFILLLSKTDSSEAEKIVQRMNSLIDDKQIDNMILSISFGLATKNKAEEPIDKVYLQAEERMYRNKLYESANMKRRTINRITKTLFEKNEIVRLHCEGVSDLCKNIAFALGLNSDEVDELSVAGMLHDIGKIGINDKILDKPEILSEQEWIEIRRHPEIGYQILRTANEFSQISEYILSHHERLDGKGYPKGLKEDEISLQAKILHLADTYDAMTSDRSYRKACTLEEAVIEIRKNCGTQFDTEIAKLFVEKVLGKSWD